MSIPYYVRVSPDSGIRPNLVYLITAHHPPCQLNRTWQLHFRGHWFFLCTRCLGQYLGIGCAVLLSLYGTIEVTSIPQALVYFLLLPMPTTVDWIWQTVARCESKNWRRFTTGFLFGFSAGVFIGSLVSLSLFAGLFALSCYAIYMGAVILVLRHFRIMSDYLAPYQSFLESPAIHRWQS